MNSFEHISNKLSVFIRRHYLKQLVIGSVLFVVVFIIILLMLLGVESLMWLSSSWRLVILIGGISIGCALLIKFIVIPVVFLFKLKQGLSQEAAARIIGNHFPEIGDKLVNVLDLAKNKEKSELLVASIEQKSSSFQNLDFSKAVRFNEALKYLKYLSIPLLVMGALWFSGNTDSYLNSYKRVVNFSQHYNKPAPFSYNLTSKLDDVLSNESYMIMVQTIGDIRPSEVWVTIDDQKYLMSFNGETFEYSLPNVRKSFEFSFSSDDVISQSFSVKVVNVPILESLRVNVSYPNYLRKNDEVVLGTGNVIVPEGTSLEWNIKGNYVDKIFFLKDSLKEKFDKEKENFVFRKKVFKDMQYGIKLLNNAISVQEGLNYTVSVVNDEYPEINITEVVDSINIEQKYYVGNLTDDYGIRDYDIVCTNLENSKTVVVNLGKGSGVIESFEYTFPSGLSLEQGFNYEYYFQVRDNHYQGKVSRSKIFSTKVLGDVELERENLGQQEKLLDKMSNSLDKMKREDVKLEELNELNNQKSALSFNDKADIKSLLEKRIKDEKLLQDFSKNLKDNLEKQDSSSKNKLLKERLERQEKEAKKNEALLKELNKIADKIKKEDLTKKLEELAKSQKSSKRNLEQLLELTKRYYVTEKISQVARDLEKLAKEQDKLAKKSDDSSEEQKELNDSFDELAKDLNELLKDNEELQQPLSLDVDKEKSDNIKEDQQEALDKLQGEESNDKERNESNQKQKSAAKKLKELGEQLQSEMAEGASGADSIAEDAEMLRQILDNLVLFSFNQEELLDDLGRKELSTGISKEINRQQELRKHFEHVDDSLFALSLRRIELSEFVNKEIEEIFYNIDKSLEEMAEGRIYQTVSKQKYVLSSSNSLADFLANTVENMEQSMQMGQGKGEGEGFQLPDIIAGQKKLNEKLNGKSPGEKPGKEGKSEQGEGSGESKEGKGEKGSKGETGKGNEGEGSEGSEGEGKGDNKIGSENGEGKGVGKSGNSSGVSEYELEEMYEIYRQQQEIKQELEEQLKNFINKEDAELAQKLLQQMDDFEQDLLENGITQRTKDKSRNIEHELLKLENATLKQGEKKERESNRNLKDWNNPIMKLPDEFKKLSSEKEILKRDNILLRGGYSKKVKEYFND